MGQLAIHGSGGGTASEDVTATKKHVLTGKMTVTTDSNDEIVSGTMPDNSTRNSNGSVPGYSVSVSSAPVRQSSDMSIAENTDGVKRLCMKVPEGYYPDNQVFVGRSAEDLGAVSADHVLQGDTFSSADGLRQTGTMPRIPQQDRAKSCYAQNGTIYARMSKGAHIDASPASENLPELIIPPEMIGLEAWKIRADQNISGLWGTIPVKGFGGLASDTVPLWDNDQYAVYLPGGGIYEKADSNPYVIVPLGHLRSKLGVEAHKILQGEAIANIAGTAPRYDLGRVAFSGATFDDVLLSGVANSAYKGMWGAGVYIAQGSIHTVAQYGYFDGMQNGGLQIRVSAGNRTSTDRKFIGFALDHSVNLTPFRTIRIGYHLSGSGSTSYAGNTKVSIAAMIAGASGYTDINADGFLLRNYANVLFKDNKHSGAQLSTGIPGAGQNYFDVDVAGLQGQHYITIGANASVLTNNDNITATVIINHIEFIN